ncbi:MAG TPA: ATP-binding protein [Oligoflexus sp.]|uniref:ATP-binding protein n=1 Tax=Oligoflexus sp. TaxID=1971216 RepID=UPI002D258957|nr:ATP-binding protein [Oligoflexus sp.]HYX34438.1 ATP-binding protein [Oligoflexus sp.]
MNALVLVTIQFVPFHKSFIYIFASPLFANAIAILAFVHGLRHKHPHAYYLVYGAAPGVAGNLYQMALLGFNLPLLSFQELGVPIGMTAFAISLSMAVGKETRLREEASARKIDQLNQDLRVHILNIEDIVAAKTAKIQSIMENIKQGIFTINRNLSIDPEHSAFLEQVLQVSRIDSDPVALLYQGTAGKQDEMDKIRSAILVVLGEPKVAFDLNQDAFPTEITRQLSPGETQILECEWSPILDTQGLIDRILVCIRDVTETRKLLMQTARQTENSQILSELLGIEPRLFHRFIEQATELVLHGQSYRRLIHAGRAPSLNEFLIPAHTLKGLARSLNLGMMTELIHRIEGELTGTEFPPSFVAFQNLVDRYRQMSESLHSSHHGQSLQKQIEMSTVLQNFRRLPPPVAPVEYAAWEAVKISLEALCLVSVDGFIEEAQAGARRLARDLHKPEPIFDVQREHLLLTPEQDITLRNVFLHLIRNAMDHGIEDPELRRSLGKNPVGHLTLKIKEDRDLIRIEFSDDGRGLLVDRLIESARAQGALASDAQPTQAEIADLMFLPGLSTAATMSDISGRGIGMFAVRKMMDDIGGSIAIVLARPAREALPFSFSIQLPKQLRPKLAQTAHPKVEQAS